MMMTNTHTYLEKVGEDTTGQPINIRVFEFKGTQESLPKTYIQSSMHAAELQGSQVIQLLLQYFKQNPPLGDVTLVPQCNPIGASYKMGEYTYGRFDPITGDNWNRFYFNFSLYINQFIQNLHQYDHATIKQSFKQYMQNLLDDALSKPWQLKRCQILAYTLQKLSTQADLILDLHTDSNAIRYLYAPVYAKEAALATGMEHILLMENEFGGALDEASFCPWWHLSNALKSLGIDFPRKIEGITFEFGSQETVSHKQAEIDAYHVLAYLNHHGIVNNETFAYKASKKHAQNNQSCYLMSQFVAFYAPLGGLYDFQVKPGDTVTKGQIIAYCTQVQNDEIETNVTAVTLPFKGVIAALFDSGAVCQGAKIANIFKIN